MTFGRLRIGVGIILLLVASAVSADVVPFISDFELLTTVTDADGRATLVGGSGLGVTEGYAYAEISTKVGTFVRVPKLAARTLLKFTGLRDDANYWTFVFASNAETGETALIRVTTPTATIGSDAECHVSPCAPPASFYGFAVIVHRPSASLAYVGAE